MPTGDRVLVPFDDLAEVAGPEWPFGLRVDVWDGTGDPPADLDDVALHVLPYGVPRAYEALDRLPGVRIVQSLRAGVDELLPLVGPDVVVANGRGLHDASTAEHALALILAAQRELPRWVRDQDARRWDPHFVGSLADRRVLLVGAGAIGGAIARRLEACEAQVVPVARRARPDEGVHAIDDLDRLLPDAEIVVLVVPDTADTRGLLDARRLALLPDGALVVNVGRGSAIDTAALVAEAGRLRAALDVVDPEPLPADHPLWTAPGILITPHVAGGSATFPPRARRLVVEQLRRFAAGQPLANVIERP
ncbi:D-3-phosphoglycerate dehydrogenase [Patulibacter medicamentivorans]|uniref:D-3-phosphoglycerate dehydrogenase n=1 Tax=Patulibacter medicamentivorans TaxID=1097667 RepID=H0E2H0_9ACTN|nr:2-hydroxyacid dehydrogenase [Patulibacter medicamentivorans]EHN12124.1 D-3-phosphoglycerate dehydrogenase [Patulibacter medicamentivorans]